MYKGLPVSLWFEDLQYVDILAPKSEGQPRPREGKKKKKKAGKLGRSFQGI